MLSFALIFTSRPSQMVLHVVTLSPEMEIPEIKYQPLGRLDLRVAIVGTGPWRNPLPSLLPDCCCQVVDDYKSSSKHSD
jgi:hypothetical protein